MFGITCLDDTLADQDPSCALDIKLARIRDNSEEVASAGDNVVAGPWDTAGSRQAPAARPSARGPSLLSWLAGVGRKASILARAEGRTEQAPAAFQPGSRPLVTVTASAGVSVVTMAR